MRQHKYLNLTFCRQFLSHVYFTESWSKIKNPYATEGEGTEATLLSYIMVTCVLQVYLHAAAVEKRANGVQWKTKLWFLLSHHHLPERQQKNLSYSFYFRVAMLDYMFSCLKRCIHSMFFSRFNTQTSYKLKKNKTKIPQQLGFKNQIDTNTFTKLYLV